MQELEPVDEGFWPTKGGDQVGHVVGSEEGVEPNAGLICWFITMLGQQC